MITKEEVLKSNVSEHIFDNLSKEIIYPQPSGSYPLTDLLYDAMEQYADIKAKEKAIEFAQWVLNCPNYILGNPEYLNNGTFDYMGDIVTTEELYNLFIEQK